MKHLDVAEALASSARDVRAADDLDAALDLIVRSALETMTDVDHVGITLAVADAQVEVRAASDDTARALARAEHDAGDGPGAAVSKTHRTVLVEHLQREQRWPTYVGVAARLGVRAQLGVGVLADARTVGVLTVYSSSHDTLRGETLQLAGLFAVHAGLVVSHARRLENLGAALESRRVIGLALGLVMQRLGIDEDTAFAYLTRLSATSETKLRDVAASVVEQHAARLRGETAEG